MNTKVIAELAGRNEKDIKEVRPFAWVLLVIFHGGRPTFVSLRKYQECCMKVEIELSAGRRQNKVWLARITGKCPTYRFEREFMEPVSIDWGRKGMNSATFHVVEPGLYHDSDDDYFIVELSGDGLECRYCSKQEIEYEIEHKLNKVERVSIAAHIHDWAA